jgi:hypothetical protein
MGTERQEKHTVIIIFLTSEGHKAIWGTLSTDVFLDIYPNAKSHRQGLVLRPLPELLGAFSQGQMPIHTSTVPLLALTIFSFLFF